MPDDLGEYDDLIRRRIKRARIAARSQISQWMIDRASEYTRGPEALARLVADHFGVEFNDGLVIAAMIALELHWKL